MPYEPVKDEHKKFSLREFETELKVAITGWANSFENANEFCRESHTWLEWLVHFLRFMSW